MSVSTVPPTLRLFLDCADPPQWTDWLATGLFYGITTNPLLLARSGTACSLDKLHSLAETAFALGAQEVQLQTWRDTVPALVERGQQLAAGDRRIVVKVPITQLGTLAATKLIQQGIRVTLTAVYAPQQVLMAAALGADYAAPYLGRINDLSGQGRETLVTMQQAIAALLSPTRLLVASIRSIEEVTFLATQGLNTFTLAPAIAAEFFNVAATQQATADFERAAEQMSQ
ncbi:transaldolase family protein [Almyronema epifaneia]|uniref:Transaldolase family protein n=1 Tax=Almyronema epifaneia S1 TaxID=2991925 RepID=A0ABW6IIL3_9CYAN